MTATAGPYGSCVAGGNYFDLISTIARSYSHGLYHHSHTVSNNMNTLASLLASYSTLIWNDIITFQAAVGIRHPYREPRISVLCACVSLCTPKELQFPFKSGQTYFICRYMVQWQSSEAQCLQNHRACGGLKCLKYGCSHKGEFGAVCGSNVPHYIVCQGVPGCSTTFSHILTYAVCQAFLAFCTSEYPSIHLCIYHWKSN